MTNAILHKENLLCHHLFEKTVFVVEKDFGSMYLFLLLVESICLDLLVSSSTIVLAMRIDGIRCEETRTIEEISPDKSNLVEFLRYVEY